MPVLDSSFLIDLQLADPAAVRALERLAESDLIVPGQALKEFAAGFDEPVAAWHLVNENYRVVLEGEDQVILAARLHRLAKKGKRRAPWADIAIAAQAKLSGTYVVTANPRDFASLGCIVWDYRRGGVPPG